MIHVCDAIMGSGKSQSAISFMNDHPDRKFIYITPYLDEAKRIYDDCPTLHFVEPNNRNPRYKFSKVEHTKSLLQSGQNVASTHSAFCLYSADMIDAIKANEYTLIIDEAVSILTELDNVTGDVDLLEHAGCIVRNENGIYSLGETPYGGGKLSDLYELCERNNLVRLNGRDGEDPNDCFFFWEMRPDVLASFKDVYILTYLFDGQDIKYYLEEHGLEYDHIGIRRTGDRYEFAESPEYMPSYIADLESMIDITEDRRLNRIGDGKFTLSVGWYRHRATADEVDRLRKNLITFFRFRDPAPSKQRMWTCYEDDVKDLKDKGVGLHTPCNLRATNKYRDKTALAYCVNNFVNPFKKRYLSQAGHEFNEDAFALSVLIQWIWRSAIRDGEKIRVYIPSQRMRELLKNWIRDTQSKYHAHMEGGECRA